MTKLEIAKPLEWLGKGNARLKKMFADVKTLLIAKGSSLENGYVDSFNRTIRDELLSREIFLSV